MILLTNYVCLEIVLVVITNNFKIEVYDRMIDSTLKIKWTLWSTSEQGRYENIDYEGSVLECVNTLQEKFEHFLMFL